MARSKVTLEFCLEDLSSWRGRRRFFAPPALRPAPIHKSTMLDPCEAESSSPTKLESLKGLLVKMQPKRKEPLNPMTRALAR